MNRIITTLCLLAVAIVSNAEEAFDTLRTAHLGEVVVAQSIKDNGELRTLPASTTAISSRQLEDNHLTSLKKASTIVPNMFIPDYGSRLTSAIYIRGVGSRLNTSAVGLYVDDIPYNDKSAFDFKFNDIQRIDILRGPQGTLYGSNTMGGIVRIYTKNPFHYEGTDVKLGFATRDNHRSGSVTHYHHFSDKFAVSVGGYYEGGDGFFRNITLDKKVDGIQALGGKIRALYRPSERLLFDLNLNYDYSDEGAYPYYYVGTTTQLPSPNSQHPTPNAQITNNRESSYYRNLANAALNIEYVADGWMMNAVTGYQFLKDRMFLDQDFIADDIYTLEQRQRINSINEEVIFKSTGNRRWEWLAGINLMYQSLHTTGPVVFYNDGLRWLEGEINSNMPPVSRIKILKDMGFQDMAVNFRGDNILMDGTYDTPKFDAAVFHQSTYHFTDHLSASLGLRLDNEYRKISYFAPADINYGFRMPNTRMAKMGIDNQQMESHILYEGKMSNNSLTVLPKFTMTYTFDNKSNIYASIAKGQRSGGYNLQMFSDLLQGAMRVDMMGGVMGIMEPYLKRLPEAAKTGMTAALSQFQTPTTDQVVFKPEYAWNYELGGHFNMGGELSDGDLKVAKVQLDAALFYSRIFDQQIARFAPSGLGRMMVNAGKSRSLGGELSLRWRPSLHWNFLMGYGFTRATFTDYDTSADDKGADYSGNYVPFVPMHTLNADASYTWFLKNSRLTVGAGCHGAGRIYWTESNNAYQNFYALLDARATLELSNIGITLWGKNLTGTRYNTFYFESANRCFEQHSTPFQLGIDLSMHF